MSPTKSFVLRSLYSESQIRTRIEDLVKEIMSSCVCREWIVIGLLKGSFMFLADLARQFYYNDIPIIIDFMGVSSYGSGTNSSGQLKLTSEIAHDIQNQNVLLVDDILDTGRTLKYTYNILLEREPALMKTCVLLDKPERRIVPFQADYVGFTIPNHFVAGYGLDYDGRYRERPDISILSFEK